MQMDSGVAMAFPGRRAVHLDYQIEKKRMENW